MTDDPTPTWILRRPGDPGFITVGRQAYTDGHLTLHEWCALIELHMAILIAHEIKRHG